MKWQLINTAPEGEDVMVFAPDAIDCYQRMICHRIDGDWYQQDADQCPQPLECAPTHWMPLPEPPNQMQCSKCDAVFDDDEVINIVDFKFVCEDCFVEPMEPGK